MSDTSRLSLAISIFDLVISSGLLETNSNSETIAWTYWRSLSIFCSKLCFYNES